MILTGDYHTHSPYSHGKNTIAENAERAKELGLKQLGISDHGFSHITYGIQRKQVPAYRAECAAAAKEYGLDVLVGIEANICGVGGQTDFKESDYDNFDIFLCGFKVSEYPFPFPKHFGSVFFHVTQFGFIFLSVGC